MKHSKPNQDMTIHRMPSSQRGVIIDKEQIQNPKMSLKATGLYCYICSMPDGWIIRREDLMKKKRLGHNALQTIINELKALGYLKTITHRDTKGRVVNKSYEFYEYPISTFVNHCNSDTSIHNSKIRIMDDVPHSTPAKKHQPSEHIQNPIKPKISLQIVREHQLIEHSFEEQNKWKRTPTQ